MDELHAGSAYGVLVHAAAWSGISDSVFSCASTDPSVEIESDVWPPLWRRLPESEAGDLWENLERSSPELGFVGAALALDDGLIFSRGLGRSAVLGELRAVVSAKSETIRGRCGSWLVECLFSERGLAGVLLRANPPWSEGQWQGAKYAEDRRHKVHLAAVQRLADSASIPNGVAVEAVFDPWSGASIEVVWR